MRAVTNPLVRSASFRITIITKVISWLEAPSGEWQGREEGGMEITGKPKLGGGDESLVLPPVREDLRLYPGPAQRDGSPTWRVLDPVRN